MLSCGSLLCAFVCPYGAMKYFEHNLLSMASSTPISLSYVEIFPFIFCFVEKLYTAPLPKYAMSPMCFLRSLCTAYEAYIHHFTTDISLTIEFIFRFRVTLSYFKIHLSFPQLSLSIFFTSVLINPIIVYISWRALSPMNSICGTVWWKVCACSSNRYCV